MRAVACAVALGGAFSWAGQAEANSTYTECSAGAKNRQNALVPDQVILAQDRRTGEVTIADSGGISSGQLPSRGKVIRDTNTSLTVQWSRANGSTTRGVQPPPVYLTLSLKRKSGKASLSAKTGPVMAEVSRRARCAPLPAAQVAQIEKLLRNPKLVREVKKNRKDISRLSCTLSKKKIGYGFLPRIYEFELPQYGRKALVWDSFSLKHSGGKTSAKFDQERWPQVVVSWNLSGLAPNDYGRASGDFDKTARLQATLDRSGDAFRLRLQTRSGTAPVVFKGSCKPA